MLIRVREATEVFEWSVGDGKDMPKSMLTIPAGTEVEYRRGGDYGIITVVLSGVIYSATRKISG